MDDAANSEKLSRNPTLNDIIALCRHLNAVGAQYVIIGGIAMIYWGFDRTTSDIDLLIDDSEENVLKIREALRYLPDNAIQYVDPTDVSQFTVVRVGDEIIIDLLGKACGIPYHEVKEHVHNEIIGDVKIPYIMPDQLLKTKQTYREQDVLDRMFLENLLREKKF